MNTKLWIPAFCLIMLLIGCENATQKNMMEIPMSELITTNMDFAIEQYKLMNESLAETSDFPRTIEDNALKTTPSRSWTSGFFPGSLWYLYEYTDDPFWRKEAERRTEALEQEKDNTGTHDLGFMLYNSFGNGYRLTGNETYKDILITGAYSLASRFNENVGCIRSWDHGDWQFPVIIDNMMNLEYLFWTAEASGDDMFKNINLSHADTTIKHHYRDDYSTWHVVDYDTITGEPIWKGTHQGYADESSWSRGQSWGLYGYTLMYRETKDQKYLDQAVNVAEFLLNHPNMPENYVPYWDFNAPDIPNTERDASAGAIMASALIELSQYVDDAKSNSYLSIAETIVRTLSTPEYRAEIGTNEHFLLKHSVGSKPHDSEIDVPLVYADYYYLECLLRFKDLNEDNQLDMIALN